MDNFGEVEHHKGCFTSDECKMYFSRLLAEVPWTTAQWKAGRNLPRKIFRYDLPSSQEIEILDTLVSEVEDILECKARGVWCNLYENGLHYTPPHQDNYGANVVTLSFGSTRRCIMKNINSSIETEYLLDDGDIFYFSPSHDAAHKHSIPKASAKVGPRISIVIFTETLTASKNILDKNTLEDEFEIVDFGGSFQNVFEMLQQITGLSSGYLSEKFHRGSSS